MASAAPCMLYCWLAVAVGAILSRTVNGAYEELFVFGGSYVDTGNHDPNIARLNTPWRPPYGLTWPGVPSGRYSDGRVFTDLYASFLNLTLPIPYRVINDSLSSSTNASNILRSFGATGINFGFGGSGVFPTFGPLVPTIDSQIDELKQLLSNGVVSNDTFRSSIALLVVAENDYIAFLQNHTVLELPTFIPQVVAGIASAMEMLYELGFKAIAISNLEPAGCLPTQTIFSNYTTCNATNNVYVIIHNSLLAATITAFRVTHLKVTIFPLDFYTAFEVVVHGGNLPLRPCCQGVNGSACGDADSNGNPLYTICPSPQASLFWDSFHPSDNGWRTIFKALISTS